MYQQFQEEACEECDAVKLVRERAPLTVTLDPGAPPGSEIRFFEEGEPEVDGDPGDLVFVVRPRPHPRFERRGDDLLMNATIPLADALTGFTTRFAHLDGRRVPLTAAGVTAPGATVTLAGEGMPRAGAPHLKGDLHVTFAVEFPAKLSEKQKKAVRDNFKARVRDEL
jgi:DnaJ family protein B protein 11